MTNLVQTTADYGTELLTGRGSKYLKLRKQTLPDGRSVEVAKYSKKAFYDQAWLKYPMLEQARGHVFIDGKIVTRPFDKVFNFSENSAGQGIDVNQQVEYVRKINGFFAAVTMIEDGTIIFQSSGSVDSENDFVAMFKRMIVSCKADLSVLSPGYTVMFEVCHESDPHIIKETTGLYLIGYRDVCGGYMYSQNYLKTVAKAMGVMVQVPFSQTMPFGYAKKVCLESDTEGGMIRCLATGEYICKIKSKEYLAKKLLARASDKTLSRVISNTESFDEEVVACVDALLRAGITLDKFQLLSERERLDTLSDVRYGV